MSAAMRSRIAATLVALLQQANTAMVRQIAATFDPRAVGRPGAAGDRGLDRCGAIRSGPHAELDRRSPLARLRRRHLQREWLEAFATLIQSLSDTPQLRTAGVAPPSRQLAITLIGGPRELIAATVEDGGDISDITDVAVQATRALLGLRGRAVR
jgi:hypothetical protein